MFLSQVVVEFLDHLLLDLEGVVQLLKDLPLPRLSDLKPHRLLKSQLCQWNNSFKNKRV